MIKNQQCTRTSFNIKLNKFTSTVTQITKVYHFF